MPPGYAQEPPYQDDGKDETYCGFKPPQPDVKVRRDFIRGGGFSAQFLTFSIGQYDSGDGAEGYLDAFAEQLETCTSETLDGEEMKYAVMSVPQVGDRAMGLRTEGERFALTAGMAKAGQAVIIVGGGGPMEIDVDLINEMFEKQVQKYIDRARG